MKKQPWMTYALLGVILVVLVFLMYFKPRQNELKAIRADRMNIETQLEDLKIKKRQFDKMNSELKTLNDSLAELEPVMPRKREQSEILRNFQQMAYDQQLELIRFGGSERESAKDFYSEWPIPIEVAGNYHSLGRFFDRILHFPRIFIIDEFSIRAASSPSSDNTISAMLTAKTYFFLEETLIKKPEPDRPKRPVKERNEF